MKPTRSQIRAVLIAHGFTVKPGEPDLKPYVYDAAEALINAACASMSVQINAEGYAVAPAARWHYPANGEPAPHGAHVQLLTLGGKQVDGIWRDSGSYIAWAPQLKRDKDLEGRLGLV